MKARPKIQKLDIKVANQIAAGEVVERPAAVVKELVENSLDAGATRIEVEFEAGGKTYLCVEDNGYGMSQEEAHLALQRHATSKLTHADDLLRIQTFGFRGEALPSIASICEFQLSTRVAEQPAGWSISVHGGQLMQEKPCSKKIGTRIEVRHLFYPVPARRKFLKTDATEAAHIVDFMRLYALDNLQTTFVLKENKKIHFETYLHQTLEERFVSVFGPTVERDFMALKRFQNHHVTIYGFISRLGLSRTTREGMAFLVNHRPVRSRLLSQAVTQAYHTFIPPGRFPMVFLLMEVDPAALDVNIHPTKQEVRFRDESIIRESVIQAIRHGLESAMVKSSSVGQSITTPHAELPSAISYDTFKRSELSSKSAFEIKIPDHTFPKEIDIPVYQPPVPIQPSPSASVKPVMSGLLNGWRFLSHWENPYSLLMAPQGLVVLNRKRAQNRIDYEAILKDWEAVQQPLIHPISLSHLPPAHLALIEKITLPLEDLGFKFSKIDLGYQLESTPPAWSVEQTIACLEDFLDHLPETLDFTSSALKNSMARFKIKSKKTVSPEESGPATLALMEQLWSTPNPLYCPDGHKIYVELPFKAIQNFLN